MNLPEHQLKVYYPYGGEHFILRWHSHNEGHNLILARSKASAERTFQSVLRKYSDTKAKEFLKINIVAPTDEIRQEYAKNKFDNEVRVFWGTYVWMARDYKEKFGSVPAKLKECQAYSSDQEGTEEKDDEAHYYCLNCFEGFFPVSGTLESIYLANRDAHLAKYPDRFDKRLVECQASPADTNKRLYTIGGDFGHHQEGIVLGENRLGLGRFFFFYQDPVEVDRTLIDEALSAHKKAMKSLDNAYEKKMLADRKKREEDKFKELLEIFG